MKLAAVGALLIVMSAACSAHADGLQSAYSAVGNMLKFQGGGLAPLYASCPKNAGEHWDYVSSALFVPISQTDNAVLINGGLCDGGNLSIQYLILNQHGNARVVTDAGIADMSFIATGAYFCDDKLTLVGNRWLPSDPHCCASKRATLEFNLKTGDRKLTIVGDNK